MHENYLYFGSVFHKIRHNPHYAVTVTNILLVERRSNCEAFLYPDPPFCIPAPSMVVLVGLGNALLLADQRYWAMLIGYWGEDARWRISNQIRKHYFKEKK